MNTSLIDSFTVGSDGLLTAAAGSPFAAQGLGPFGSEFRPTNSTQLFVSNAHDGPGNGSVSAFAVAADGTLSSIGASPVPNNQTAPCWVEITHDGQFLFAVNTAVSTISSYSIAANGALTLLGNTTMNALAHGAGGRPALAGRLDAMGRGHGLERDQRVRGQRRHAHRARFLADARSGRRSPDWRRRHLKALREAGAHPMRPPPARPAQSRSLPLPRSAKKSPSRSPWLQGPTVVIAN